MDVMKNMLTLCVLVGLVGLSLFLIVHAVLRWLAVETEKEADEKKKERSRRLNILAGLAVVGLLIVFLYIKWDTVAGMFSPTADSNAAANTTGFFIEIAKFVIKLLLLVIAVASVALLSLIGALFLRHGLRAVIEALVEKKEPLANRLKKINENLTEAVKTPIFAASITWGLLALFICLPLLVVSDGSKGVMENWESGIYRIVGLNQSSNTGERNFYEALIKYVLLAIIVLGVAFAAFKLLYSIASRVFKENRRRELIDEYSGAIGVLSVGVAVLWTLQSEKLNLLKDDPFKLVWEFFKAFAVVMIIVALIVLTLEIIRLLLDMREKLIRREARLLFTFLIGQVSLLLHSALNSLYDGVNSAIGNTDDHFLDQIQEKIKGKMVETMDEELSKTKVHERTFTAFDEVVTKADEGEKPDG